tara:strand:+ start:328 stop:534 length:207 start_codon:yes stop_codon:yes gene_type:complete
MNIEIGSIVTNVGFIQGRNNSNHGVVVDLLADGKIARVFWASTQKSGFCSVSDLMVMYGTPSSKKVVA